MKEHIQNGSSLVPASTVEAKLPWWRLIKRLQHHFERPEKAQQQTYDFLPAALEVQETPPSPIGRAIVWLIIIFFVLAALWAFFGRVDIVATAQGKIIPSGRVKTLQPLEIGTIAAIHVKEGQTVKAGDPLLTLDATASVADTTRLSHQLRDLTLNLSRQQAFLQFLSGAALDIPERLLSKKLAGNNQDFSAASRANAERLLLEQVNEYQSRLNVLDSELRKRTAEMEGADASITKLSKTLPIITERSEALKKLFKDKLVAKAQYLELEEQRIREEQDLVALQAKKRELKAAVTEISSQQAALKAEFQKNALLEMNELEQNLRAIEQELVKARQRDRLQLLSSPIDGTVQQLAVHTVGGVVTPAQELMLIVPEQDEVEVEAFLLNKDIGFVWEGHVAEVKIDTFNFTKYGTINARVIDISNDAIQDENLGLVYLTRVLLDRSNILVNGKWINLSPGMAVTVEVKTGKRRIIEFFLSPLLRYKEESIRER